MTWWTLSCFKSSALFCWWHIHLHAGERGHFHINTSGSPRPDYIMGQRCTSSSCTGLSKMCIPCKISSSCMTKHSRSEKCMSCLDCFTGFWRHFRQACLELTLTELTFTVGSSAAHPGAAKCSESRRNLNSLKPSDAPLFCLCQRLACFRPCVVAVVNVFKEHLEIEFT